MDLSNVLVLELGCTHQPTVCQHFAHGMSPSGMETTPQSLEVAVPSGACGNGAEMIHPLQWGFPSSSLVTTAPRLSFSNVRTTDIVCRCAAYRSVQYDNPLPVALAPTPGLHYGIRPGSDLWRSLMHGTQPHDTAQTNGDLPALHRYDAHLDEDYLNFDESSPEPTSPGATLSLGHGRARSSRSYRAGADESESTLRDSRQLARSRRLQFLPVGRDGARLAHDALFATRHARAGW